MLLSSPKKLVMDEISKDCIEVGNIINKLLYSKFDNEFFYEATKPYFQPGGKKIRPLLLIYFYKLFKGEHVNIIDIAPAFSAIEIVHNASLIIDDIYDKDRMRRETKSFFLKYGTFSALSIAYNLSTYCIELSTKMGNIEVISSLAEAGSDLSYSLYLSQSLSGDKIISEEYYMDIIQRKTATLFKTACEISAILCTLEPDTYQLVTDFGNYLGLAYQLRDDFLAVEGTLDDLGKSPDSDIINRFQSIITINAMKNANKADREKLYDYYINKQSADIVEIKKLLIKNKGTQSAKKKSLHYKMKCIEILKEFPESPSREKLFEITNLIKF